jgi:hypothetical protein
MANKSTGTVPKSAGRAQPKGGSRKGIPNKATQEFRETVRRVLDDNRENVGVWLTQVAEGYGDAKPAPDKALDLLAKLAEFAAPKLARTEHTGDKDAPVHVQFAWAK